MLSDLTIGILLGAGGMSLALVANGLYLLKSLGVPIAGRLLTMTIGILCFAALMLGMGLLGLVSRG